MCGMGQVMRNRDSPRQQYGIEPLAPRQHVNFPPVQSAMGLHIWLLVVVLVCAGCSSNDPKYDGNGIGITPEAKPTIDCKEAQRAGKPITPVPVSSLTSAYISEVSFGDMDRGLRAETVAQSDGGLRVKVNRIYEAEPFLAMSGLLAHEMLHQDGQLGQPEEVIASAIEAMVYGQILAGMSVESAQKITNSGTALVRLENTMLWAMINSGKCNYPNIGLLELPSQNAMPGSLMKVRSFDDYIRQTYFELPDIPTPGNALLRAYVQATTGEEQPELDFSNQTIALLDAKMRPFKPGDIGKLATILGLSVPGTPIAPGSTTP
jgi:hypothetical protein